MEMTERAAPEVVRQRRVGTFTLGVTLVFAGALMAVSLFRPRLDLSWALKASPAILILLGIETLLAARGGSRVKYDWAGMVLCFLLTGAALCMYAGAWYVTCWTDHYGTAPYMDSWMESGVYEGSRSGDERSFLLDYGNFHGRVFQVLELEAGERITWEVVSDRGSVEIDIVEATDRAVLYTGPGNEDGVHSVTAPADGEYEVWVTGTRAAGSAHFLVEGDEASQ